MLADLLHTSVCPACGHHVAVSFFDGESQPLATIAWPRTMAEAQSMPRLPLSFVRCVSCGHVYNKDFDYALVPYSEKPNLMFNRAPIWREHLRHVANLLVAVLPENPRVVEIGCGDGSFLRLLAEARPQGNYVGFDPHGSVIEEGTVQTRRELFDPAAGLEQYRPDMVISRHVLEHLVNPLGFVQRLAFAASWLEMETHLFIEVPCVDRVFETGRIADFYYEHNSHFSTDSFSRMLGDSATEVRFIERGYNGEVIYGLAKLGHSAERVRLARQALEFRQGAKQARDTIRGQLKEMVASGKRMAIWGGTGKGAAFINYYGLDEKRFGVVVDSDRDKIGTFVPGAGQEIRFGDSLRASDPDVVIIPTQWRAKDIVAEMMRSGIKPRLVLIEHRGRLVDYHQGEHPYR